MGNRPVFRFLDDEKRVAIAEAALALLARVGVQVTEEEARALLHGAGARLDGDRVRLPAAMVEDAIQSAPSQIAVYTPAGLVRARAQVEDGSVMAVTFENVPAFVWRQDALLAVPDVGELVVDVAFGGLFFVLVHAGQLDVELVPANATRLADFGMRILAAANEQIPVEHPDLPHIDRIIDMRFYVEPGGVVNSRNVVVLGERMVDRSPCGTGTCAEMALRYARGQLDVGQPFVAESMLGTRFTGRVLGETQVGGGAEALPAVRPQITGSAYITGLQQFVLQPGDPFPEGFLLG